MTDSNTAATSNAPKKLRGFAAISPERQREIARAGGKASHASGNAHEFTPEEAREAGRLSHQGSRRAKLQAALADTTQDI